MGLEFSVTKELASASATIIELVSVTKAIQTQLGNNDFVASFNGIMVNLSNCYSVIEDNFLPWLAVDSQAAFEAQFDELFAHYSGEFFKRSQQSPPNR